MRWPPWVLLPLAGALAAWIWLPRPHYVPDPQVIVTERVIREGQPPAQVRWRDRIVYRYVPVMQTATAPAGATAEVERFCRPVVLALTDTVTVVDTVLVIESIATKTTWWMQRTPVEFVGYTNMGDLHRMRYAVRPGWSARAVDDSLLVRYPRFALLHQGVLAGAPLVLGYLAGRILHGGFD